MSLFSNALSVVRQALSSAVGDLIMGTFASGSTTTGVHNLLRKGDDYYNNNGYRGYIYEGTNIGVEREVSDWVLSTNTLTLAPAFSSAIDSTSKYELHHIFTEDEYRKAINLAIARIGKNYLIDKIDVTTVLVADTYEYSLPSGFIFIHRITTEDTADSGTFENEDEIDIRDWHLIASRKLKLDENRYSITAGKDLRLEGHERQAAVTADTSIIYLPLEWVVQKAITFLPMVKIQNNALQDTYKAALGLSAREPRNWPNPKSRQVIE